MLSDPSMSAAGMPISLCMDVQLRKDVELREAEVRQLVGERQRLRAAGASDEELERNRSRLVSAQHDLGLALIRRYLPSAG
jgi:hypothetical protein